MPSEEIASESEMFHFEGVQDFERMHGTSDGQERRMFRRPGV